MRVYAEVLSYGAGVNSTALAIVAVRDGWRGELVFADTGCEWPETYEYLDYFEREWLGPRGLSVTRLGPRQVNERYRKVGENTLLEYCERWRITPFAARRWCTLVWKVAPMARHTAGRSQMIGIAADEARRRRGAIRPLVELGITRAGCAEVIQAEGLEVPPKSGCYICPFMLDAQWRRLWEVHPELFERAACLEEASTARRGGRVTTSDPRGKLTLRDRQRVFESQMVLSGVMG